jgi:hypothetical protein
MATEIMAAKLSANLSNLNANRLQFFSQRIIRSMMFRLR